MVNDVLINGIRHFVSKDKDVSLHLSNGEVIQINAEFDYSDGLITGTYQAKPNGNSVTTHSFLAESVIGFSVR